jgi:hypothetical protein
MLKNGRLLNYWLVIAQNFGSAAFPKKIRNHKSAMRSTLALLMPGILADDTDNILPFHDLTRFTKSFY